MSAGGTPSWAMTSSSAALFGGGGSMSNGRAAAEAKLAPSSDNAASSTSSLHPPREGPNAPASSTTAAAPPTDSIETRYKPKRKQRSITRCPPLSSTVPSAQTPYATPYVDEPSANEALFQLIAVQAKRAGFDATTASALHEVSQLAQKFLTSVFCAATHAAELSCRDQPSARDLVYALETHGQPIRELRDFHRQQLRDGEEEDEKKQAFVSAREKAKANASAPQTYRAKRTGNSRRVQLRETEDEENEADWLEQSDNFLPSDSDKGSEMDAWSVSSDSDDEHKNRRAAIQARIAKRKHDLARAQAKRERRLAKLHKATAGEPNVASSASSSTRDLRALTSGEQAWRRVADHVVPRHLPGMPPRHTWVQTPAFPTNAYGSSLGGMGDEEEGAGKEKKDPLMLVNRKLANARLVEASLRRLIQNTDGAAAMAYASSTKDGAAGASAEPFAVEKEGAAPVDASAPAATANSSSGFAVPKTPASGAGSGLTLRLKQKMGTPSSSLNSQSQLSSPVASRRASTSAYGGGATASGAPETPLGMGMSTGWGGELLMSPLTPVSAHAGLGSTTPYPPTPGGVYGAYFGSNHHAVPSGGGGGYRSRSQSIVAAGNDAYASAMVGDSSAGADKLGVRVPGPINYKNVWYAPGSTIASGGLAGGVGSSASGARPGGASSNHPRSVKRMRKWKV